MLIIWGSRARQQQRGVVADRCDGCQGISIFSVIDVYKVSHLYYISLGAGKVVATALKCLRCGAERPFVAALYAGVMPAQTVMNPQEVLRFTNPRMYAQVTEASTRLEALATVGALPSGASAVAECEAAREAVSASDSRVQEAFRRLDSVTDIEGRANVFRLRLVAWQALDEAGRQALLEDIEAFVQSRKRERRTSELLTRMSGVKPPIHSLVAFWLVAVVPVFLVRVVPLPPEYFGFATLGAMVGGYYLARSVASQMEQQWFRDWFRTSVVPSAEKSQVAVSQLCELMRQSAANSTAPLLAHVQLLQEVATAMGRWDGPPGTALQGPTFVPAARPGRLPSALQVVLADLLVGLLSGAFGLTATRPPYSYSVPPPIVSQVPAAAPAAPAEPRGPTYHATPKAPAYHATARPPAGPSPSPMAHDRVPERMSGVRPRVSIAYPTTPLRNTPYVAPRRSVPIGVAGPPSSDGADEEEDEDAHRRDTPRTADGRSIPPQFAPRPYAPPGIENAWVSAGFDGLPVDVRESFHPHDEVCVSVLFRDLRPDQQITFRLHRDAGADDAVPPPDDDHPLSPHQGSGYTATKFSAPGGFKASRYTVIILLDGRDVRHLAFDVVPL
jgi:hypothetical protein